MQTVLTDKLDIIRTLCDNFNVQSLFEFGSVCTERFDEKSDVDFLITFKPMEYGEYADTYFEFTDKLEDILDRPVDLVTDKSLGNPFFIESINKTKTLIYGY